MNRVYKLLIIAVVFTLGVSAEMPNVLLKTDKSTIKAGQELKVVLGVQTLKDAKVKLPNIKDIAGYGIKSKRVSTAVTKITGKDVLTRALSYAITPTKSFTIKPYSIVINGKTYKTNSVKVTVKSVPKDKKNSDGFIFKMSSSKKAIVVGEPFLVSVELIEPVDVSSADLKYTPPNFKGFKVMPLGDGDITEKGNTVVRSLKYLLTPKRSGKFIISPAKAKIGMQMTPQAQSPFGFFGADIHWKNISSNSLTIKVYKQPNGVELIGDYTLKAFVDKSRVKASKPVTYTIKIEGEGSLDDFEDIKIDIPNVTQYSKDSKIDHRFENSKVYTVYKKEYVFIAKNSYTIPEIVLKAYSPIKHRIYTLKANAIHIKIEKTKSISSLLSSQNSSTKENNKIEVASTAVVNSNRVNKAKQNIQNNKIENILFDKEYYKRKYSKYISGIQNILIALFIGLLLGIVIGIFMPKIFNGKKAKKANKLYGSYKEAMHILYPHIDEDKKIEEMVKFLYEVTNGNKEIVINDKVLNKMVKKVMKKNK